MSEANKRLQNLQNTLEDELEKHNYYINKLSKLRRKLSKDVNKYYHLFEYKNELYHECEETADIEKKKLLRIKMCKISSKMAHTEKKNDLLNFEYVLLEDYVDYYHKRFNNTYHKIKNFRYITNKNSKMIKISNKKAMQFEKETCCICLDCHKIHDLISTKCRHKFGQKCFERIIKDKGDDASCPYCRKRDLQFALYCKK